MQARYLISKLLLESIVDTFSHVQFWVFIDASTHTYVAGLLIWALLLVKFKESVISGN